MEKDILDEIKSEVGKQQEEEALKEVAYGNQHTLNILLDLLIEKGVISEQEFKDKLNQDIEDSPDLESIKFDLPDDLE